MKSSIVFDIVYEEMHDLLAWKRQAFFYLILGNGFCGLIVLFAKFKDASIFGKMDTKSS